MAAATAPSSTGGADLTPAQLFERFRKPDIEVGLGALREFEDMADKNRFLQPTIE